MPIRRSEESLATHRPEENEAIAQLLRQRMADMVNLRPHVDWQFKEQAEYKKRLAATDKEHAKQQKALEQEYKDKQQHLEARFLEQRKAHEAFFKERAAAASKMRNRNDAELENLTRLFCLVSTDSCGAGHGTQECDCTVEDDFEECDCENCSGP